MTDVLRLALFALSLDLIRLCRHRLARPPRSSASALLRGTAGLRHRQYERSRCWSPVSSPPWSVSPAWSSEST
jgi:hypothetical protein